MALRLTTILAVVTLLPVAGKAGEQIGIVKTVAGRWCRQATDLKKGNPISLTDDVRYCASPMKRDDKIEIRFDRKPQPYDRTYACATPGICDSNAALWLAGANAIRKGPPPGSPLISAPAVMPDTVVAQGDTGRLRTSAGGGKVRGGRRALKICHLQDSQIGDCNDLQNTEDLPPGLYGLFTKGDDQAGSARAAAGLVAVVKPDSKAQSKWNQIPQPYLQDESAEAVAERRAYLLELLQSENK